VVSAFGGGGAPISTNGGAVTANVDVCITGNFVTRTKLSNIFSGPTPVQSTSFGALKARYR
jgi:hypothetical protein